LENRKYDVCRWSRLIARWHSESTPEKVAKNSFKKSSWMGFLLAVTLLAHCEAQGRGHLNWRHRRRPCVWNSGNDLDAAAQRRLPRRPGHVRAEKQSKKTKLVPAKAPLGVASSQTRSNPPEVGPSAYLFTLWVTVAISGCLLVIIQVIKWVWAGKAPDDGWLLRSRVL
jgi:hypothetical protein